MGTDKLKKIREAGELYAKYGSYNKVAEILKVDRSTAKKRILAFQQGISIADENVADEKDTLIEQLMGQLQTMKVRFEEAKSEADTAATIRKRIFKLAEFSDNPPPWLIKKSKPSAPGVPMTLWSDWHYGEVVKPEEVAGRNEFSSEIAEQRIKLLVNKTISLAIDHMVNPDYPGIVVCLGGDMISGDIHEELADTNDAYPSECIAELCKLLIPAFKTLADAFGNVFVPCVVGNHGRTTKKPRLKGRVHTSYEWILYTMLEASFRDDKRVVFHVSGETDVHFKVYNHRFHLTHGDTMGVKGGDGIIGALGPIMRGAIKVAKSESLIGREYDTILMGHWHQYLTLPGIIVNGSLKGYDEYARLALRAQYQPPIQALWFLHEIYGITAHWAIYLDKKDALMQPKSNWISLWDGFKPS